METSPGGGTRSEVGEQQARQPPAQDTGAFNLQPYTQHGKHQGRGAANSSPIWSMEGPGTELWSASHTAGCTSGGSHQGLPPRPSTTGSAPSHSFRVLPHISKASAMIKGGGGPAPGGRAVSLLRGGETGLGAREYIHVAKAGSWGFQCHPGCPPEWQQWGAAPQQA